MPVVPSECINLSVNYFDDAKTKRMVGLLGRGAEAMPLRLWCYCGKHHAEDGRLAGYSVKEIEAICAWWGKEGAMVEAFMRETIGYLVLDGDDYVVQKWTEWQGHIHAIKRKASYNANKRWEEERRRNAASDASSKANSNALDCADLSPLSPPVGGDEVQAAPMKQRRMTAIERTQEACKAARDKILNGEKA